MVLWEQARDPAWEAPSSVAVAVVAVVVSPGHLLSLAVVLALVGGWRSKLPLQMHLLPLAVVLVVAVAGWRQRLPLGTQLGIRTCACPGDLSGLCN